jgi:hypothetical protein
MRTFLELSAAFDRLFPVVAIIGAVLFTAANLWLTRDQWRGVRLAAFDGPDLAYLGCFALTAVLFFVFFFTGSILAVAAGSLLIVIMGAIMYWRQTSVGD